MDLQAYGEYLMQNKLGSIIMIDPKTGEILCMVSAPSYNPAMLTGRNFGKNYKELEQNTLKPLFNHPDRVLNAVFSFAKLNFFTIQNLFKIYLVYYPHTQFLRLS